MSFIDMQSELRGVVPKFPQSYAPTLINRAWRRIRESHLWSFNIIESAWTSPAVVTQGTVTVAQGSASVTFDVDAIAALNASFIATPVSPITARQLRVGVSGIYNIIQYDGATGLATLDRLWFDPSGTAVGYQVYQVYYAAPVLDYLMLVSVRNPQMFLDFDLTKTREWLDRQDPQRYQYTWPAYAVPWGIDLRGAGTANASATLNYQLYELWGQPVQQFTYQVYGLRRGADLTLPGDTLPVPVGEDLVIERAKEWVYEWAESNRDILPRGVAPDYKFLMQQSAATYRAMLIEYRRQDKNFLNNYRIIGAPATRTRIFGHFNSISMTAGSDY
jgi:hypothetical protein